MGLTGESCSKIQDGIWVLGSDPFVWDFLPHSFPSRTSRMGHAWQLQAIFLQNLKHFRKSWKNWIFHEKSWFSIDDEISISHKICIYIIQKPIFCLKKENIINFQKINFLCIFEQKNDFLAQKVKKRIFEKNRFFVKWDIQLRV